LSAARFLLHAAHGIGVSISFSHSGGVQKTKAARKAAGKRRMSSVLLPFAQRLPGPIKLSQPGVVSNATNRSHVRRPGITRQRSIRLTLPLESPINRANSNCDNGTFLRSQDVCSYTEMTTMAIKSNTTIMIVPIKRNGVRRK
jgi:hypothetical protein